MPIIETQTGPLFYEPTGKAQGPWLVSPSVVTPVAVVPSILALVSCSSNRHAGRIAMCGERLMASLFSVPLRLISNFILGKPKGDCGKTIIL